MCVIAVCKERFLTEEEFTNCFNNNDDGFGYAYMKEGYIYYSKGFIKLKSAWNEYRKLDSLPHIAHFRKASGGSSTCKELTHPFSVSDDSPLLLKGSGSVLFHNGTYKDWHLEARQFYLNNDYDVPAGELSDSRFMAILVAIKGIRILKLLKGKFVYWDGLQIITKGDFISKKIGDKEVLFSNHHYLKDLRKEIKFNSELNLYHGNVVVSK